jgi:ribonuclease R
MPKRPPTQKTKPEPASALPSREEILAFLAANPGQGAKRDVARHFGLKGSLRADLRRLVRELQDGGALETRGRKRFGVPDALPEFMVLEIIGRDADGELLARPAKWESPNEPPPIVVAPGELSSPLGIGEKLLGRLSKTQDGYVAKAVKRLGQAAHRALGVFRRTAQEGRVEPTDRKTRLAFAIPRGDENGAKPGDLVVVAPGAGRIHGLPRARVVEVVGPMDRPGAISLISIHTHGIPDGFPKAAEDEAKAAEPPTLKGREDLRAIPLVTIDPDDARDHDDAVHAEPDPAVSGGWIVTVAIADVAAYVRRGSVLDREALARGNSTYFPDRVAPMLPEHLSAGLCSLREGENRACLAVRMRFDPQGRKVSHTFVRGLMRSAARLTYSQVQNAIDGRPDEKCSALLGPIIRPLYAAYAVMRKGREAREPLAINAPERRVKLGEDGRVASVEFRPSLPSMQLIEEMMIQANVAAAETLEDRRTPLLYRIHDTPSKEKLHGLTEFLDSIGMKFALGQKIVPAVFNRILGQQANGPYASIVNEVVLRSQAQAVYAHENIGHFGLNLRRYAHFTSPIRRYADLIVHRALIRALGLGDDGLSDAEIGNLKDVAELISQHERRSMAAEREAVDRYLAAFMEDRIGAEFAGRVSGVSSFGLFVRLSENGADGLIPIRSLGSGYLHHDRERHLLVSAGRGPAFGLGDEVRVKLLEAAPVTGGLRFELVDHTPLRAHAKAPRAGGRTKQGGREKRRFGGR